MTAKVQKYICIIRVIRSFFIILPSIMMLELHSVTIGQTIRDFSMTLMDGKIAWLTGDAGCGKTTLLRAIIGLIPIDSGHISIDGELLTPLSAPYFRRQMAYVPQYLSVPDGYNEDPTDYVKLVERAVNAGKQLLIIDEPHETLDEERRRQVDAMLAEALQRGCTILAVGNGMNENTIRL
jgi:ABC-type cobalamin/Fe3+-siderophores transport system ATPase subunit